MDKKMQLADDFAEKIKEQLTELHKEHGIEGLLLLGVPKKVEGEEIGLGMVHVSIGDIRKVFLMLKAAKKETKNKIKEVEEGHRSGSGLDSFLDVLHKVAKKHAEEFKEKKSEATAGDGLSV